jgi:IS5 family transposase
VANRFETRRGGFADMAVASRKQPKTFLDDLDKIMDWKPIEGFLKKKLRRHQDAVGNPAYPALGMFKILLLQRWHDLSDQKTAEAMADRISFCRFAGFSLDHESPDASTICRFRNHLEERGLLVKLFNMINEQLEAHGILVRTGSSVDATLIPSARQPRKVEEVIADELASEHDEDEDDDDDTPSGYTVETTYSDDHDARWTKKGKVYCYGYKGHIAVDTEHGFILTGHATAANRPDCKEFMNVVEQAKLETGAPVLADKGYSSAANRCDLDKAGFFDLIMYKAARGHPLSEAQRSVNHAISRVRGSVERAFGSMKKHYGLSRAKYLGVGKVSMQLMLCAMAFNLKKAALMAGGGQ